MFSLYARLTIRGRANDEAVLCTQSRTYALRAVTLSNTILITTAPATASASASLVVRDQVRMAVLAEYLADVGIGVAGTGACDCKCEAATIAGHAERM